MLIGMDIIKNIRFNPKGHPQRATRGQREIVQRSMGLALCVAGVGSRRVDLARVARLAGAVFVGLVQRAAQAGLVVVDAANVLFVRSA